MRKKRKRRADNLSKVFKIVIIYLCTVLLSGCNKSVEPNELAYVVAIGIDKTEGEEGYSYTLQIADPMTISGGSGEEGGKDGEKTVFAVTVTAPSVFSAVNLVNHMYSKEVTLAHTKLIAISDKIATEDGIKNISEAVTRSEEIRPNTHMTVVIGEAGEYLRSVKPKNEVNPVKYYEDLYNAEYTGYVPKVRCMDFYAYDLSNEKENVLALSAIYDNENNPGRTEKGFEYQLKDYIAGSIDGKNEDKAQTVGMAVFFDDKMIATAGAVETELYNILTGDYDSSEITYYDKKDPYMPVTVLQSQQKKPKITVLTDGDRPKIDIKLYLEADLRTVSEEYLVEQELDDLEEQIIDEIKSAVNKFTEKTAREYRSDIIGFGSYAKRNFSDFDAFKEYNWQKKYPDAEFSTEVEFHLRRSGLINRKRG